MNISNPVFKLLNFEMPSRRMVRRLTSKNPRSLWSNLLLTQYFDRKYSYGDKPEGALVAGGESCTTLQKLQKVMDRYRRFEIVGKVIMVFIIIAFIASVVIAAKGYDSQSDSEFYLVASACVSALMFFVMDLFRSKIREAKKVYNIAYQELHTACYHLLLLYALANEDYNMLSWKKWHENDESAKIDMLRDVALSKKLFDATVQLQIEKFSGFHCSGATDFARKCSNLIHDLCVVTKRFGFKAEYDTAEVKEAEMAAWKSMHTAILKLGEQFPYLMPRVKQISA